MKHKDNCEQLFEYLRSILYDDKVNALQIDDLELLLRNLEKECSIWNRRYER